MLGGRLAICNMALGFVGERLLASLNERTPEALYCKLYYDTARKSVLREFPWSFATMRIYPGECAPPPGYEDKRAYLMPPDVIKVTSIRDGADYELRATEQGICLVCGEEDVWAEVIFDQRDEGLFPEDFGLALAYKLALLIATPLLKNNPQKIQELARLYESLLPSLYGHAASEGRRQKAARIMETDWIEARSSWN